MSFTSRLLSDIPGIRYAFLDVHETAAFPYSEMAPVKLVHSNIVHEYRAPQAERPHADAMFTAVSGQKMGVVTADCLPLLMASRDGRYVCSVHAGWRGAASGIIENSLALFQRYHVDPQDLVVVSGPHIHPCCYEVTGDFYQALLAMPAGELAKRHREQLFLSHQAASEGSRRKRPRATMRGSICGLLHLLLRSAGVPEENMEWLGSCTYCTPQRLGSFRRRTHFPAPKSFQYSWIMREPDETK
jgi:YfiH family protein